MEIKTGKTYEPPEMEVVIFEEQDVIITSKEDEGQDGFGGMVQ